MRRLLACLCLATLAACGGSPTSPKTPGPGSSFGPSSPAAVDSGASVAMTGAVRTTFPTGAGSCVITTSKVGGKQVRTLVFSGARSTLGYLLYLAVYPFTGPATYRDLGQTQGTQVTVTSLGTPGGGQPKGTWQATAGSVVVSRADQTAAGTLEVDLRQTVGGTADAHLSGSWSCSVQALVAPSPSPTR